MTVKMPSALEFHAQSTTRPSSNAVALSYRLELGAAASGCTEV